MIAGGSAVAAELVTLAFRSGRMKRHMAAGSHEPL